MASQLPSFKNGDLPFFTDTMFYLNRSVSVISGLPPGPRRSGFNYSGTVPASVGFLPASLQLLGKPAEQAAATMRSVGET